ncbi:efflux transporter outer membrane subunit [Roseomonas sp. M0104]|uniref:Efflux transporter outer membrane subunit n=1 Tax=Teichococcus coralli TaxID=2545983 RepID=A0A845B5R6_9PROT|nr:efflux transporter outer membrane subunit [Pseudoroseomonas coralli]MXP62541.1 efflux transporter outer membrane subunit [Pseudoroseomonas coralli]
MSFRAALAVALAGGLAACTVGPDFVPPRAEVPPAWSDAARNPNQAVSLQADPAPRWWTSFNDPALNSLIERTVAGNPDLQQAVLRIVEARQAEAAARGAGLPSLNGSGTYTRQQLGLRGLLRSQGAFGSIEGLRNNQQLNGQEPGLGNRAADALENALNGLTGPSNLFQLGFDASWELDLFGRVRRSVEQANAQTQAAVEGTNDALVTLLAEVAQTYAGLRGAQALARTQQQNVDTARDLLRLTERRRGQGLTTELDVANQRAQLASYEAQLQPFKRQAQQAMNRLSVLTGQPPGALDQELSVTAPIPPTPPSVPVGLPSSLARRRPDIRQAEARLHAATAGIGVATAQFYPDISLTGSIGVRAIDADYLTNWASHFYSFGPAISLPIFQGGRLTANLRLARAQQAGAALAYRGTVLNALREVEDSLVAYRTDKVQRDLLERAVKAAETALSLARSRYNNGLSNFLDVLDAQRSLVEARQQRVRATLALTTDLVSLYKALGGGWQEGLVASVVSIPPPEGGRPVESLSPDSLAGVDPPGRPVPTTAGVGPLQPSFPAAQPARLPPAVRP